MRKSSIPLLLALSTTMHCSKARETSDTQSSASSGTWLSENNDTDSDGDGRSDFAEVNKYLSDPNIADNDSEQRRESTYTVRNVMEILKPIDIAAMNSDYQDARILEDREKSVLVEIISYPFSKAAERISANTNWRRDYAGMTKYLAPSRTADWDEAMQTELLAALAEANIHPDQLSDRELVEKVTNWISSTFANKAPFTAYFADFSEPEVKLLENMRSNFNSENPGIAPEQVQETVQLGVSGKRMFQKRWSGSCTPTAILQTTILRALGIPTRIILTVPLLDPNNPAQWEVLSGIENAHVKQTIHQALDSMRGWIGHTYNEVFVGGRWVKLNYNRLGQGNLDSYYFGLMIQVNTMVDWADVDFAHTWSARVADATAGRPLVPTMTSVNQYQSVELSDKVGSHNQLPQEILNPPQPPTLPSFTVTTAQWADSATLPAWISALAQSLPTRNNIALLFGRRAAEQRSDVMRAFTRIAPKVFELKADGLPTVTGVISEGSISLGEDVAVLLNFSDEQRALIQPGIIYSLTPRENTGDHVWVLPTTLTLER